MGGFVLVDLKCTGFLSDFGHLTIFDKIDSNFSNLC